MKKTLLAVLLACLALVAAHAALAALPVAPKGKALPAANRPITSIAFGSDLENRAAPILRTIATQRPDLMLFLGDNVFGLAKADAAMPEMQAAYRRLAADQDFGALRAAVPTIATWDDHDYGANDGGADFPFRETSKTLFSTFWGRSSRLDSHPGVYDAFAFGPRGRRLQIILLDTRYDRSPLTLSPTPNTGRYLVSTAPDQRMLSQAQWTWLEQRLREPADLRLVVSSIQVLADGHAFEAWRLLPAEQARLYDTIRKTKADGVIFLSGDRVSAGLYRLPERLPYPAVEATSSALNLPLKEITGRDGNDEVSTGQQGALYADPNFGRVNIDWRGRSVTLEIRSVDGRVVRQTTIPFSQLRAQ